DSEQLSSVLNLRGSSSNDLMNEIGNSPGAWSLVPSLLDDKPLAFDNPQWLTQQHSLLFHLDFMPFGMFPKLITRILGSSRPLQISRYQLEVEIRDHRIFFIASPPHHENAFLFASVSASSKPSRHKSAVPKLLLQIKDNFENLLKGWYNLKVH